MNSLLPLLKAISTDKTDLNINSISTNFLELVIDRGMGAYLKYCTKKQTITDNKIRNLLNAADLTAKLITNVQIKALNDLIDLASPKVDKLILLKGISTCQNHYPIPHLRIMSDIDILVSSKDSATIKNLLLNMGYKQVSINSAAFYQTHHHIMPFYNKGNNVWIEVHTHLFSGSNPALEDDLFKIDNIFSSSIDMYNSKYPKQIKQLCPELQLIYTILHWTEELKIQKTCLIITDIILLIKNNGDNLNWNKIFDLIDNTVSASSLMLALSYLDKHDIIKVPACYLSSFKLKNKNMGYINKLILHKIITRYTLSKESSKTLLNENNLSIIWLTLLKPRPSLYNILHVPWNLIFPPYEINRYKLSYIYNRVKKLSNKRPSH